MLVELGQDTVSLTQSLAELCGLWTSSIGITSELVSRTKSCLHFNLVSRHIFPRHSEIREAVLFIKLLFCKRT